MAETSVIRRKLAAARAAMAEGSPGADRGWRLALARAARDAMKLPLEVPSLRLSRASLAELLEMPADRALFAVLEGPAEGMGLLVLSPPILQGLIEQQTLGRVQSHAASPRKPTRTDAAMVAGLIDAALAGLEQALAQEADLIWAGGFRYASFLDDARPLGLLLEDFSYRILQAEVSLAHGARSGEVLLALPAEGRGTMPSYAAPQSQEDSDAPAFARALADRVEGAASELQAALTRVTLPLATIMSLRVGEVVALPTATLDHISIEGIDGRTVGLAKLGQNRGMRALRVTCSAGQDQTAAGLAEVKGGNLIVPMAEPMRQAG